MSNRVVTRFPPSPTGYLHIGGARTALFNWAMARKLGGKFFLRFENTDRKRSSKQAEQSILEDLQWLGLDWDNPDDVPRQSERLDLYHAAIRTLRDKGLAYDHPDANGALVFKMPKQAIAFEDMVRGRVNTPAGQIEDFVILKAPDENDGKAYPTYHLAVVVDDADMGVTHVLRGADHLTNTAKHIALQQALDLPMPTYGHISLTTNPDNSKVGKRDKAKAARAAAQQAELLGLDRIEAALFKAFMDKESDEVDIAIAVAEHLGLSLPEVDVRDFRAAGYLPSALNNFLALLGWNPGDDIDRFGPDPLAFLTERFDPGRFIKGNATFDREKLAAFNSETIRELSTEQWRHAVWHLPANQITLRDSFASPDDPRFDAFCAAYQERSKTLRDPIEQGAFFFVPDEDISYDFTTKPVKKAMKGEPGGQAALELLAKEFGPMSEETFGTAAHDKIKALAETNRWNMGKLAQPLRVAVSGSTVTPPIDLTLEILGKAATLARIANCLRAMPY